MKKRELLAGGSVGRKLDFIAQEMNREANTILSKSTDLEISDRAILLKNRGREGKRADPEHRIKIVLGTECGAIAVRETSRIHD